MKGYGEYEELIVARLENTEWNVAPLPLTSTLNTVQPRPLVYVIFTGSTFDDTPNLGDFAEDEALNFEVYITARTRTSKGGVFEVADEVIERLLKWQLPDATRKIKLHSFGYVDGVQNNWQYVLKFGFPRVRVMREEAEEHVPIKKITNIII